jgi:hypothetical protein
MSSPNSLWLGSAIYLRVLVAVDLCAGVPTVGGWLTFMLAGSAPMLIASRLWSTPEPSLSQQIRRELR